MNNYNNYVKKVRKIKIYSKYINKKEGLNKSVEIINSEKHTKYKEQLKLDFIKIYNQKFPWYEWLKYLKLEDALMFIPECLENMPYSVAYNILNSIIKDNSNNKYSELILYLVKKITSGGYFYELGKILKDVDSSPKYYLLYKEILNTIDDTIISNPYIFFKAYNYVSSSKQCELFHNSKGYLINLAKESKNPNILFKLSEMQKTNKENFDIDKETFLEALDESDMTPVKKEQFLFEYGIKCDLSIFDKFNSYQEFLGYIYLLNIPKNEKKKLVELAIENIGGKYVDDIINSYEEKEKKYADQLEKELDEELDSKVRLISFKNKERKED